MDKIKLHYVVHYTFRGWWDYVVPKEKEELGKIETYECLLCKRRFRNNHNKKQYPGKHVVFGSVVEGMDVVKKIESYGSQSGKTSKKILISNCGQL